MRYEIDTGSDVPPSRQLVDAVLDAVACGSLKPGAKLLSVRAMAAEALINPNTVARAYRDLEAMGVVVGRSGKGVFITDGGPALAREAREEATLVRFEEAARAAARAGHGQKELAALLRAATRKNTETAR